MAAFSAGVVVGWVGRGVLGTEREVLLRAIGAAQRARLGLTRLAAEQVEWWQDLVAEAKARVDLQRKATHPDENASPTVVRVA